MTTRTLPGWIAALLLPTLTLAQSGPRVSFDVEMRIETDYIKAVDAELICDSGAPRRSGLSFADGEHRRFELTQFEGGDTACRVRAQPPDGYRATYRAESRGEHSVDGNGCRFRLLSDGESASCLIRIHQEPVRITVYKQWIGASGEEADVEISLECESGRYSGRRYVNDGAPGAWEIRGIEPEGVLCNVYEEERETYRPDIIDCQGLLILPGKGEECTMVNTKIVKRIEMLNRYGIVVMIAVFLIVGLTAVRRFV